MTTVAADITNYSMLIGGRWVGAESGKTYESMNPYTGQAWASMPDAGEQDVDKAVEAASVALRERSWRRMVPAERGAMLGASVTSWRRTLST